MDDSGNGRWMQTVPGQLLEMRPTGALVPDMGLAEARDLYKQMVAFVTQEMHQGIDYGVIPGTAKKTLYLPGAEKLATFFNLKPKPELLHCVEDWTGKDHDGEPFFYYLYRVHLVKHGEVVGAGDGSCNSWEEKYRSRWVAKESLPPGVDHTKLQAKGGRISEPAFAIKKAETTGQYGKPAEYWQAFENAIANGTATKVQRKKKNGELMDAWEMDGTLYRLPNDKVFDQVNTFCKMAQKRAYMQAITYVTNASEFFTQDLDRRDDDLPGEGAHDDEGNGGMGDLLGPETLEEGKQRLVRELVQHGYSDRSTVGKALQSLGITYTLEEHDVIRQRLIDARPR